MAFRYLAANQHPDHHTIAAFLPSDQRGVKHVVGVASGLSALEMALRAYKIGPGDEVITAANTFIATVLSIVAVGARPVLVDMDACIYNMDPAAFEAAVTSRTRAVMPVHLYGQPANLEPILAIAERHNLLVIEDAAQARQHAGTGSSACTPYCAQAANGRFHDHAQKMIPVDRREGRDGRRLDVVPDPCRQTQHGRRHWLVLAGGHLNRRRFGTMLGRIALLPVPTG